MQQLETLDGREKAVIKLIKKELNFDIILEELNKQFQTSKEELSAALDKLMALGLVKEL